MQGGSGSIIGCSERGNLSIGQFAGRYAGGRRQASRKVLEFFRLRRGYYLVPRRAIVQSAFLYELETSFIRSPHAFGVDLPSQGFTKIRRCNLSKGPFEFAFFQVESVVSNESRSAWSRDQARESKE